jgi:hypothetical protein
MPARFDLGSSGARAPAHGPRGRGAALALAAALGGAPLAQAAPGPAAPRQAPATAAAPERAPALERRLHSDAVEASSFLWNDWNKFVENYHPNYVADDDPTTAWVEGGRGTGAGEWIRIQVTPLDRTSRVRLRVRNGYQKSPALWRANARAKAVTVRLLPSGTERRATLADADGWQEVVVDQPSGTVRAVELRVDSVYEGARYPDLCISDVQVLATSATPDNPAFEKSKRDRLVAWRAARIAAARAFGSRQIEQPLYSAYEATRADGGNEVTGISRAQMLELARRDPALSREWKDALAAAVAIESSVGTLARAQLAPTSAAKLVPVDGIEVTSIRQIATGEGPYFDGGSLRLPLLGLVASLFADQLRVLDLKDALTVRAFEQSRAPCGPDAAWVARVPSVEAATPARVAAVAVGRCARVEGREGSYIARTVELMVYDALGRLALVVGEGHVDAYRWVSDGGKPMLEGGRSLLWDGGVVEVKRRQPVAQK